MGKGKLIAGIILIIIGAGLIPASFGMENLLNRRMDESIVDSIAIIRSNIQPTTTDLAYALATPEALLAFKDVAIPDVPGVVNGSVSSKTMSNVIEDLTGYIGENNATEWFFNDPSWTVNTDSNYSIQGISEYNGLVNLSFTPLAITQTLSKFETGYFWGLGINEYLSDYENSITDQPTQDAMVLYYNSTWEQIQNVSAYLIDYLFPLVPSLGSLPFEATDSTAEDFFYLQWINATLVPGSWTMEIALGLFVNAWEYKRTELNLSQAQALWNTTDTLAPLNEEGIRTWWESDFDSTIAQQLKDAFNLNDTIYENLMDYFFNKNFKEDLVDTIYTEFNGQSIGTYGLQLFYLQWANGEVFTNNLTRFNPLYAEFELTSYPDRSDIDFDTCVALWDANRINGVRNKTGISVWKEVASVSEPHLAANYDVLMTDFGLNDTQMDYVLDWVINFRASSVNVLTEAQGLDYHPDTMIIHAKTGTYIAAGIIGFIGLMFVLSTFKKER